jgi:hypothetical protein
MAVYFAGGCCKIAFLSRYLPKKENIMKKLLLTALFAVMLMPAAAFADPVHDWHDLDAVHRHVVESIHEMERARANNHYDMAGHGAKAEALLRQAEQELSMAIGSSRAAR